MYAVTSQSVAVTGSQDLIEIAPASNKIVRIVGWHIGATGGTADAGDAQEELLSVSCGANATASGSGGTTPTIYAMDQNDTAGGFTAEANNTTKAAGSFTRVFYEGAWNNRVPDTFYFTPELQPTIANAQIAILRLNTAPADSLSISTTVWVEEMP